jgi:hypothetical protein
MLTETLMASVFLRAIRSKSFVVNESRSVGGKREETGWVLVGAYIF